mgnify:CR=1 FL=1
MSNDTERKPIPLPPFLYESDGVIRVGYDGDTDVTDEYNEWIGKLRVVEEVEKRISFLSLSTQTEAGSPPSVYFTNIDY